MESFIQQFIRFNATKNYALTDISNFSTNAKCKYYAHQILACRWAETLYDLNIPLFITQFAIKLKGELSQLYKIKDKSPYLDTIKSMDAQFFAQIKQPNLTVGSIGNLLELPVEVTVEELFKASFYKPYIHFLLNERSGYKSNYSCMSGVSFPTMKLSSGFVALTDANFPAYRYDHVYQAALEQHQIPELFRFYLGYDFTGLPIESILMPLAMSFFSRDIDCNPEFFTHNSTTKLFNNLFSVVRNQEPKVGSPPTLSIRTYKGLINFIKEAHTLYDVTFGGATWPRKIVAMSPDVKEQQLLNDYWKQSKGSVTLTQQQMFLHHELGVFEELNVMSPKFSISEYRVSNEAADDKGGGDLDKLGAMVDDMSKSIDSNDNGTNDSGNESAKSTDSDKTNSASSSPSNNTNSTSSDNNTSSTHSSTTSPSSNDKKNVDLPDTSDRMNGGFEVALSEGSNLDNYLFLQEVKHMIKAVLNAPKRTYREQDIALVKYINTYCLNIYSIETICNMLAMTTSIPIKFKVKETK